MQTFDFDKTTDRRGTKSVKWDTYADPELIPMWVADMDFETAPAVKEAVEQRARQGIYGYTHPDGEYYDAITSWFSRRHGWTFRSEDIIYTIGVVPALSACVKALTAPGDKVIVQTPVYTCFFSSIRNNGCEVLENPLKRTSDSYEMDFADLEVKCADPKATALILCNPHNPCGRVWSEEELRRLDDICRRHNVTVISDEIHCEIVYEPLKYVPFATVATAPAVSCISPSKAFNTAGLQTANIVTSDAQLRARIDRAININEVCDIGPFGITALIAAYNHGGEWLDALVRYIGENYKLLCDSVAAMHGGLKVLRLEGTYLAWIDVRSLGIGVEELCDRIEHEAHVRFDPGTTYGAEGEGYIRVNLGTQRAKVEEAMKRLKAWLDRRY